MGQVEQDAEELRIFLPALRNKFAENLFSKDALGRKLTDRFGQRLVIWPQDARQVYLCVRRSFNVYGDEESDWLTTYSGKINKSLILNIRHVAREDRRPPGLYYVEDENTGLAMGSIAMMAVWAKREGEDTDLRVIFPRTKKALELIDEDVARAIKIECLVPINRGGSLALPVGSMLFSTKR